MGASNSALLPPLGGPAYAAADPFDVDTGVAPLIIEVDTSISGTTASDVFRIAMKSGETYNFSYTTNDGQSGSVDSSAVTAEDITFSSGSGVYEITITPQDDGTGFPGFYYNGTNDDTKLTEIKQWGDVAFTFFEDSFEGCSNMEISASAGTCNTDGVTDMGYAFSGCSTMTRPPVVSSIANVTAVDRMFSGCTSLASFPDFTFTSTTKAAAYMFSSCSSLTGAAPAYDMSSFTSVNYFYSNCSGITSIPYCDTGSVTIGSSLTRIFNGCSSVTTFGGLNFNSISGTAGGSHFLNCSSATTISALDNMDNVTSGFDFKGMSSMTSFPTVDVSGFASLREFFYGCSSMVTAPSLTTTACTDMGYMFYGCTLLTTVPVYDTAGVLSMDYTFQLCTSLTSPPAWDYSDVTNPTALFLSCSGITSAGALDFSSATTLTSVFSGCSSMTTCGTLTTSTSLLSVRNLFNASGIVNAPSITVTSEVTDFRGMFHNSYVESCPTYDTSEATNMYQMFKDIRSSNMDVPAFDFSKVTDLRDFARGLSAGSRGVRSLPAVNAPLCTTAGFFAYTNPNLESTGTITFSALTGSQSYMFSGTASLADDITISVGSGVTSLAFMFEGSGITGLTLTGSSGVTAFNNFCYLCADLADVNLIDTSAATNCTNMFRDCDSLEAFTMPTFDLGAMTNGTNMFNGYAMSTASWEALLVATEANNSNSSVTWSGGDSTYNDPSSGATARADLIADHSWTITDGGSI